MAKRLHILAVILAAGCSPVAQPSLRELRSWQADAKAGPTEKWRLSSIGWAKNTPAMRDKAYAFCARMRPGDKKCFADQDWSLIASNQAEMIALDYKQRPSPQEARQMAFANRPAAFEDVRSYCMSVYQDAGSADARMLGPCMLSAVGGDYFSIAPVS